jgi:hypothetical protein
LFKRRLRREIRAAVVSAAGLEPGLMADEHPRDPLETAIIAAPALAQIARRVLEAGHPTGLPLARQGRPRCIAHLGWLPQPAGRGNSASRPPVLEGAHQRGRYRSLEPSMGAAPRKLRTGRGLRKRHRLTRSAVGRPLSRLSRVRKAVGR